jgi:hypothetical protein
MYLTSSIIIKRHRRPSVECYKECSIFRKAKGAREARKETLTLELNANVS